MAGKSILSGEVVMVSTSDYCRLHGLYSKPPSQSIDGASSFDAVLLVHGLGGNFYSSSFLSFLAKQFADQGFGTLIVNTRGHDSLNMSVVGLRTETIGAGFEKVSDCVADLNAWLDWLVEQGHQNVLLLGHSLGAIKALYSQSHDAHTNVRAIIALSATRLNHENLLASKGGEQFRAMLDRASDLVNARKSKELMQVTFPFPTWMGAAAYLEKYGPENRYDWFTFAESISVPTLMMFGQRELELNPAFAGMEAAMEDWETRNPRMDFRVIPEADHFYSGKSQPVWEQIQVFLGVDDQ